MRRAKLLYLFIALCVHIVEGLEKELTINVEAGKQDCFYEHIASGQVMEIDYQVIDGRHGDLDISFQLTEPTGRIIQTEFKKSENSHKIEATVTGDYKFCFDNTYSSYNSKTVYFEIIVDHPDEEDEWNNNDIDFSKLDPEEVYDIKIQEIQDSIHKVRGQLNKVRQLQEMFKSFEARDRNVAEENFFKMMWTIFCLVGISTHSWAKPLENTNIAISTTYPQEEFLKIESDHLKDELNHFKADYDHAKSEGGYIKSSFRHIQEEIDQLKSEENNYNENIKNINEEAKHLQEETSFFKREKKVINQPKPVSSKNEEIREKRDVLEVDRDPIPLSPDTIVVRAVRETKDSSNSNNNNRRNSQETDEDEDDPDNPDNIPWI